MKRSISAFAAAVILAAGFPACQQPAKPTASVSHFIDTSSRDRNVRPGDNFFEYVNGGWISRTSIGATESQAGTMLDMYNRTKDHLHVILDSLAKGSFSKGSIEQKVGDFYASGMDSATIDKLGYDPLKPLLQQISALKSKPEVISFVGNRMMEGDNLIMGAGIGPDDKSSTHNIALFAQTGLGMPDRDYYLKTDAATNAVANAYKNYIRKIFMLTGTDSLSANKKMLTVYNLEKQIAGSHKTTVELRDPEANYHKTALTALDSQMHSIGWSSLFKQIGFKVDSVNLQQPGYYNKLNSLLETVPLDTWKNYLHFHVVNHAASALSSDFVDAKFEYGKSLTGRKKIKPRWERMYQATDLNLGDGLGELYVKKYFDADAKDRMLILVNNLQKAFEARIEQLDWMSDSTKKIAVDKLHAFIKKIGYPNKWRDYTKVSIDKGKFYDNLVSCAKNEYAYQLSKLGQTVDKTEWGMTAPTINAYYNPLFNEIVFPAGILQAPLFDPTADDAINYGGIGMVIGHEMTHGFDDEGAQYDLDGNLKNWWSKQDNDHFKAKTQLVIDQYNKFTVLDTVHINGALTTGENIADMGGISIAYDAFKLTDQGKDSTRIDGLTPDQRFFISFAQGWKSKLKDEVTRQYINIDPHSPPMYRVNGPLMHFPPFYAAFGVKEGDKMFVPEKDRIRIW